MADITHSSLDEQNSPQSMLDALKAKTSSTQSVEKVEETVDINPSDIIVGKWYDVDISKFAFLGKYYTDNTRIQVQAATVKTIKYFAAMDESNQASIKDAVYKLIGTHLRVIRDNKVLNALDVIYEFDQMRAVLLINMYTGTGSELTAKIYCAGDEKSVCNTTFDSKVTLRTLTYTAPSAKADEFFNSKTGIFTIVTKSGKKFKYRPLTLNESLQVVEFVNKKFHENDPCEKQFSDFAGFYMHKKDAAETMQDVYMRYLDDSDDMSKLTIMTKWVDTDCNMKQNLALSDTCPKCNRLSDKQLLELGNVKYIFFVQDGDSEY